MAIKKLGSVKSTDNVVITSVGISDLSATGVPSATTFLRGDNTWATPAGGSSTETVTSRTMMGVRKNAGAVTTVNFWGQATPGTAGTATAADDTDGNWINYATATTINAQAQWSSATGATANIGFLPDAVLRIKTPATITNFGLWVGLSSGTGVIAAGGGTFILAAFRYFTGTDGTVFWRCVTKDTTGAGATVTATAVAVAANTPYTFRVKVVSAASIEFYINEVLVATHTTNIPPAATSMSWIGQVQTLLAGTAQNIKIGWQFMSHK